jgi:hypothetical protein
MKRIFDYIGLSFDITTKGASARKLTAFALMIGVCFLHFKFANINNAVEFLIIDLSGVFLLLGIITAEQIIKLKNGDK